MAKGRKRKDGPRNADGRLKNPPRSAEAETENMRDRMGPTLVARCRVMGWPESKWQDARDPRLATLHGRLHLAKFRAGTPMLEEREYLGISAYAVRRHRWLRAIEAPPASPKCSRLETEPPQAHETPNDVLHNGPLPEDWEAYVKRVSREFMAAEQVLLGIGRKQVISEVLDAPEDIRPGDVPLDMLAALRFTGRKLAKHFGYV